MIEELTTLAHSLYGQAKILTLLYAEFIVCLVAASLVSLFVGWMLSRSSAKKKLNQALETWEKRYEALEDNARVDTENLEEQLHSWANDNKALKANNQMLSESLKKHDATVQQARAESIELNRQHAETQERLQRVIQQKDKEIAALSALSSKRSLTSAEKTNTKQPTSTKRNPAKASSQENDVLFADTVVINHSDLNQTEALDATIQMSAAEAPSRLGQQRSPAFTTSDFDELLEDTADLSDLKVDEFVESTVVLDDETLALAKDSKART